MSGGLLLHKLHGLGNDFLVALVSELPAEHDASRAAVTLCDRRRGIGADGLIYATAGSGHDGVERSQTGSGHDGAECLQTGSGHDRVARSLLMRLWNSDGSTAEVSGNGLRCLAHAFARTIGADELDIVIHTVAGAHRVSVRASGLAGEMIGTAEMGVLGPGPNPAGDPVAAATGISGIGEVSRWETISVGNPHIVLEVADPPDEARCEAGPAVEALFEGGINVHFAAVSGTDELTMSTWERGAGATEACGTGAVAAAAVFHRWGAVGHNVRVRMTGGDAEVDVSDPVTLTAATAYIAALEADHG